MRQDTKKLLNRLGEESFKYYDFDNPSSDIDIWPMFEALLLDERVVGLTARHGVSDPGTPEQPMNRGAAALERGHREPLVRRPVAPSDRSGIFGNYGATGVTAGSRESVRDQLQRLATPAR